MFRVRTVLAVAALGSAAFAAAPLFQDHMEMPRPTAEHAELQKGIGKWEGTVSMFMPGMDATPAKATEIVTSQGPFWVLSDFTSEVMGMPFKGHGAVGYDPMKKKYIGTWIDNMSPMLAIMEGTFDEAKHMLVMEWEAPDMTGSMAPHRSEQVFKDDAYTMVMYASGEKIMTIDMKRTGKVTEASARQMR